MRLKMLPVLGLVVLAHGGAWAQVPAGDEFRVNTVTTDWQREPSVAAAGDGSFVVVWDGATFEQSRTGVFGQRYDGSGLARGGEFRIDSTDPESSVFNDPPDVASTSDGRFVVVWSDTRGGVFGRRYDAAGVPLGTDFPVSSVLGLAGRDPAVDVSADGGFVVVWQDYDVPGGPGIVGRRFDAGGNPVGLEFLANTVTGAGAPEVPDVAVASDGHFVVTWSNETHTSSAQDVFARRYDSSGNALGAQFRVNAYTTGVQRYASVAMAPGGQFVVVWSDWGAFNTMGLRFDAAGIPVGAAFPVGADGDDQGRPVVSMAADGGFTVAFETFPGFDVFARRFDVAGQPEGPRFQVNAYVPDTIQYHPAVASTPNGAFVVVWTGPDPELEGDVFARRYLALDLIFADGFE